MAREDRLRVLARIKEYEAEGRFNDDVEEDAPCAPIKPDEVDYTIKKMSSKFLTKTANLLGVAFFENMIRKKKLIILQKIAESIEPGKIYDEKEISGIIERFHPDYCTLRRDMISEGILKREKGKYVKVNP